MISCCSSDPYTELLQIVGDLTQCKKIIIFVVLSAEWKIGRELFNAKLRVLSEFSAVAGKRCGSRERISLLTVFLSYLSR